MAGFVDLPIETTPQAMLEEAIAEMEAQIEGWNPGLAEYELILFQAIVFRLTMPLVQLAAQVPATIFNEWGRQIVNVRSDEAEKATVKSTWTAKDNAGYTIKAGTQVDIARTGDERFGFIVVSDVEIPAGKTKTATGAVLLEAVEPGLEYNALEGTGILIDALLGFADGSIAIEEETAGGADAEDPRVYLSRLAETMQTFIEGVVIPHDVEIVARNVPGIERAVAIDLYNAETEKGEQEKTTTVAVTGPEGELASAKAKAALKAKLEEKREVNFLFFVIDPTYGLIDVEGVIVPMQGFGQAATAAAVAGAVKDFLSPATHGQQPPGDVSSWVNSTTLRYQDLVTVVNNVEGVDHYTTLKWRLGIAAMGTGDITLEGIAPLPRADSIAIT